MILVDTSIWADHFVRPNQRLIALNKSGESIMHPHVIGELAAGNIRPWQRSVAALRSLPTAPLLSEDALYAFIWDRQLMGTGLSFVDLHLIGSTFSIGGRLWTRDKRLHEKAAVLGCAYESD